jgi:hypothetical protein
MHVYDKSLLNSSENEKLSYKFIGKIETDVLSVTCSRADLSGRAV